jgi:hypothetical protein
MKEALKPSNIISALHEPATLINAGGIGFMETLKMRSLLMRSISDYATGERVGGGR